MPQFLHLIENSLHSIIVKINKISQCFTVVGCDPLGIRNSNSWLATSILNDETEQKI